MSQDTDFIGPIDYLIVEFPEAKFTGEGIPLLLDLVDRGIVRILDLAFVKVNDDGGIVTLDAQQLVDESGATEWEAFVGASSGLLGDEDFKAAAAIAAPGAALAILIYENTWAAPFAAAMRRAGGQLVSFGRVPVEDILEALGSEDAANAVEEAKA
jgi:hypothetical protein